MNRPLSNRERELVGYLIDGYTTRKEVAEKMGISFHTARKMIGLIYLKMEVSNKVQLVNKVLLPENSALRIR